MFSVYGTTHGHPDLLVPSSPSCIPIMPMYGRATAPYNFSTGITSNSNPSHFTSEWISGGYKGTNEHNFASGLFVKPIAYEPGKEYKYPLPGEPNNFGFCTGGFHFCEELIYVNNHYPIVNCEKIGTVFGPVKLTKNKFYKVSYKGHYQKSVESTNTIYRNGAPKCVASEIRLDEEIKLDEGSVVISAIPGGKQLRNGDTLPPDVLNSDLNAVYINLVDGFCVSPNVSHSNPYGDPACIIYCMEYDDFRAIYCTSDGNIVYEQSMAYDPIVNIYGR